MLILRTFLLTLFIVSGFSCASVERDLYFRNRNESVSWFSKAPQPGISFRSEPIKIDDSGSISISTEVMNRASGSYLWGFIVPIVPVFFLPQFQFHLNQTENLKIQCSIGFNPDKRYLKQDPDHDWYYLSDEGIKILQRRALKGSDNCITMEVVLSDGAVLKPLAATTNNGFTIFEFDHAAEKLKEFTYKVVYIQLNSGHKMKTNVQVPIVFEDFTRYYLTPVAP